MLGRELPRAKTRPCWQRFVAGLLCANAGLFAAAPTLDHIYPAGAARGSTNTVTLSGKFDLWPPKVWASASGLSFHADTNKGKLQVTVAADATPGPCLVRLFNDDGASEPRAFIIGSGREIADTEPNDRFGRPQPVDEFPVTINGRLDKRGDVDSFALQLRAGEWLEARVDSHTLMSKADTVLRLVNTNGLQLAWNHDFITLDPRLVWRAPVEQKVVLQVFGFAYPASSEIQLTGGEGAVYRLYLNAGESCPPDPFSALARAEGGRSFGTPRSLELPASVVGKILRAEDEERFRLYAREDESIEARIEAAALGSPLDAWLRIEDKSGKELARSDDADGSRDPRLEWKAPSDGDYVIALGSVTHRGGDDFGYRLNVRRVGPDYKASITASSFALVPGATNEVKFTVTRLRNFTNELRAEFRGLPEGVCAAATNISAKSKDVSLAIIAATNAPAFNGPIQLVLSDAVTKEERPLAVSFLSQGSDNGVPTGYSRLIVEGTSELWLTVRPKPAAGAKADGKK